MLILSIINLLNKKKVSKFYYILNLNLNKPFTSSHNVIFMIFLQSINQMTDIFYISNNKKNMILMIT